MFGSTAEGAESHEVDLVNLLRDRLAATPGLRVAIATPKRIPLGPGYESFAQYFHQARNTAVAALQAAAPKRVVMYHPVGFPGRPEVIRGTVAVVDDVWALVGSSSFSRRGLTFDGSIDLTFLDQTIRRGTSSAVRELRKSAMARTLALTPPPPARQPAPASCGWTSRWRPSSWCARSSSAEGTVGRAPVAGLPTSDLPALDRAIADPERPWFQTRY